MYISLQGAKVGMADCENSGWCCGLGLWMGSVVVAFLVSRSNFLAVGTESMVLKVIVVFRIC